MQRSPVRIATIAAQRSVRNVGTRQRLLEVGRRRRWSDAEKLRIVAESMAGRRQVSATARRHGISRSQLIIWRDLAREGRLIGGSDAAPCDAPTFTPVLLAADPPGAPGAEARIEIALCNGRRLMVGADVDPVAVARLVDLLDPQ